MKTCHVCGCEVDDRELICPDCGATVVKHSGALSLKAQEEVKKKTNPMGMTMSTGSGLTDILRADDGFDDGVDDGFYGGSLPSGLGKTVIEETSVKKKSDNGKVFGTIFKVILVVALLYGVYHLVFNVILNKDHIDTYEKTIEIYVDAVNNDDVDKMKTIIPSYLNSPSVSADNIISEVNGITINSYDIVKVDNLNAEDIEALQDSIKLATTKTADIDEAVTVKIRFYGVNEVDGNGVEKSEEVDLVFIKYKDNWVIETESYSSPTLK